MLTVKLLCVGRLKERYFAEAVAEYQKRLGAFCRFFVEELPEAKLGTKPGPGEIAAALKKEAGAIRRAIPSGAAVAAFCVEGTLCSSEELAGRLGKWAGGGARSVCFLIGGSHGLDGDLKREAEVRLSVSRMTFPHHLFRVMAAEQIYRAFTILEGTQYHK